MGGAAPYITMASILTLAVAAIESRDLGLIYYNALNSYSETLGFTSCNSSQPTVTFTKISRISGTAGMVPAPVLVSDQCATYIGEGVVIDLGDFTGNCVSDPDSCTSQTSTWSIWMNIDPLMLAGWTNRYFISIGGRTFQGRGIAVLFYGADEFMIELRSQVIGGPWAKSYMVSQLPIGEWFHFAIVADLNYEGTGLFVYVNGVELPNAIAYTRPVSADDFCNILFLGGPGPCDGVNAADMRTVSSAAYSNLMVFDIALSPVEIRTLYICGSQDWGLKIHNLYLDETFTNSSTPRYVCKASAYTGPTITWRLYHADQAQWEDLGPSSGPGVDIIPTSLSTCVVQSVLMINETRGPSSGADIISCTATDGVETASLYFRKGEKVSETYSDKEHEEADAFCYQIDSMDTNGTFNFSTKVLDAQNDSVPYEENSRFRTYCWNITFTEDAEIRLTFDIGNDPRDIVYVHVLPNGLLATNYLSYNPEQVTSTESPTIVQISIYDDESYATFQIEQNSNRSDMYCSQTYINVSVEYLLSISPPITRYQECVWVITAQPDNIIYVDFLDIDMRPLQTLRLGVGMDRSSPLGTVVFVRSYNATEVNGTTFFFQEPSVWIVFQTSPPYDLLHRNYTVHILLRSENGTGKVYCGPNTFVCHKDSTCIPRHRLCDGKAHCSDYLDEIDACDRCGITDISLERDEELKILWQFTGTRYPWLDGLQGGFMIYRTSTIAPTKHSAPYDVSVRNYTGEYGPFECVWRLTEPAGTRIRIQVMEFEGNDVTLSAGNGHDPSRGDPLLVIPRGTTLISPTKALLSLGSHMWVALRNAELYSVSKRGKIVLTTYDITDCEESQYTCPTDLGCIRNASQVCDGQRDCQTFGDELGCGNCGPDRVRCHMDSTCIPTYQLCDGKAHCSDYMDEAAECDRCGITDIHLERDEQLTILVDFTGRRYPWGKGVQGGFEIYRTSTLSAPINSAPYDIILKDYRAEHGLFECVWRLTEPAGTRIRIQVMEFEGSDVTLSAGNGHDPSRGDPLLVMPSGPRPVLLTEEVLSFSARMWVALRYTHISGHLDRAEVVFTTYDITDCKEKQYACPTGFGCIGNASWVCDRKKDCPAYGDELGCGKCGPDSVLCQRDSTCIPRQMLCDGKADCSDYLDETLECDRCGITDILLERDEELTILWDFTGTRHSWLDGLQGRFEMFHTRTLSGHRRSAPYNVIARNYTHEYGPLGCIWRITEPPETRIRIQVLEFVALAMTLRAGNGHDPSLGDPILEIPSWPLTTLPIRGLLSFGAHMWVAFKNNHDLAYPKRGKLVFTTYNTTDCKESQYACPTATGCLESDLKVCDGHKDCPAYGDELGCQNCSNRESLCLSSGVCIPNTQLCNGQAECDDFSDETGCGFCGEETVRVYQNSSHSLRYELPFDCVWSIVGEPGSWIRVDLHRLPPPCTISFQGDNSSAPITKLSRTKSTFTFPPVITIRSSAMTVKQKCRAGSKDLPGDFLWVDFSLTADIDCQPGEFKCPVGLNCIPESLVCDGRSDCIRHWDEIGCGDCTPSQYSCRTGTQCISRNRICDGVKNCKDISDEFDCGPCGEAFVDFARDSISPVLFTSPGWPDVNYPNRMQCRFMLMAEEGHRIAVTFLDFRLEYDWDYLTCGNGLWLSDPIIKLSGEEYPILLASKNTTMNLNFWSGAVVTKRGFQLKIEQKIPGTLACGEDEIACEMENLVCVRNDSSSNGRHLCPQSVCGRRRIFLNSGTIILKSPNFPDNYPTDLECQWTVIGQGLKVSIQEFITERLRDKLWLTGDTIGGGKDMTFELHGTTKIKTIVFSSSEVTIYIRTDSTVSFAGFHLLLQSGSGNTDPCPSDGGINCGDGSCVSTDARCNGFEDCQTHGTDERGCFNVSCPGFYHCEDSLKCVFFDVVCDGRPDCPNEDDESDLECSKRCPEECTCTLDGGRVRVECTQGWSESTINHIVKRTRKLVLSGGNSSVSREGPFKSFSFLHALSLGDNNIKQFKSGTFDGLENLTVLDISDNNFTGIDGGAFVQLKSLSVMLARKIPLRVIRSQAFRGLRQLKTLVLIRDDFHSETPIAVEENSLTDLVQLQDLYVDDHRLCCEFVTAINGFEATKCVTTEAQPPLNLCGSLMRNHLLRISMWVLGMSALFGNMVVILWRSCGEKDNEKWSHTFFVLNLAISDLMMGMYMLIIAIADLQFGENYSRAANEWRSSVVCKTAGAISVLSSEASVFFVTLISLDSFFSIVFPFSRVKLGKTSSNILVALIWAISLGLSVGPTLASGVDSKVYGLSDVCIGLPLLTKPTSYELEESSVGNSLGDESISIPVGKGKQPAWIYSIVLFLGVNLVCFLVILVCYIAIFVTVRRTGSAIRQSSHRDREIKIAIRMAMIVGTDFACWMPVIIMGILSQTGMVDISPDMYAWTVVFILPINSALNPYLYTFNAKLASRKKAQSKATKSVDTDQSNVSESKL